jgi:hypothetical protein
MLFYGRENIYIYMYVCEVVRLLNNRRRENEKRRKTLAPPSLLISLSFAYVHREAILHGQN